MVSPRPTATTFVVKRITFLSKLIFALQKKNGFDAHWEKEVFIHPLMVSRQLWMRFAPPIQFARRYLAIVSFVSSNR
jgi:hypothetical protein